MAATADIQDTTTAGEFGDRVFADLTGTITIVMAALGDRLGLFKALHRHGPLASAELANVAGVDERYTREWLNGMTCAGYLEVKEDRFSLPAAHVAVLADEGGADFMGGPLQEAPALIGTYENLVDAFRRGGGVHQAAYHPGIWEGMQRESAGIYNTMLIQEWIPAIPEVQSRLEAGTTLADVGCGSGLALIRLARPSRSRASTGSTTSRSRSSGRGQTSPPKGSPIGSGLTWPTASTEGTTALGLLPRSMSSTTPPIRSPCCEAFAMRCSPVATTSWRNRMPGKAWRTTSARWGLSSYGASLLYCMTTSLAAGGAGLGTAGLPESKVRSLAEEAGFSSVRRIEVSHPLYALYVLRA